MKQPEKIGFFSDSAEFEIGRYQRPSYRERFNVGNAVAFRHKIRKELQFADREPEENYGRVKQRFTDTRIILPLQVFARMIEGISILSMARHKPSYPIPNTIRASNPFDYENVSLDYAGSCHRAIANLRCDPTIPLEG